MIDDADIGLEAPDDLDDDIIDGAADDVTSPSPRTLVVVLAAGAGSRYSGDTHKLEAVLGDRTVAEHAMSAAIASGVGDVVIVTGASRPSETTMSALARSTTVPQEVPADFMGDATENVTEHVTGRDTAQDAATDSETVQFIHHDGWADGQASSLQVALAEATRVGADAVVVGLGDQPGITPEAWRRVASSQSPIAVATYEEVRGNPVRLHHSIWHLLPTEGDEGARSVMRLYPELVERVPCPGSAHDIDTREDLQLWQSKSSTSSP